jgi:hypothetical protein
MIVMDVCIKFHKLLSYGNSGKFVGRETVDEGRKVGGDSEFFAGDRDGEIDADRRPELDPRGVWGGAVECTDAQAVLHPAEEQLDLPAFGVKF